MSKRAVIYQLLVRTFGNTQVSQKLHGTIEENGCGKFEDLSDDALASLSELGINTLWLTGVLEQASGTSYPGRPADPADILKGRAGSPYAIRDYFDVCPDYAVDPTRRLDEFCALLERCRARNLRVLIDLVPNHVARSYHSDVRPDLSFGCGDDRSQFFVRDNHFYYLDAGAPGGGPPLKLPTAEFPGCSGLFEPETEFGRVSGNNAATWAPSLFDWYETVKLNYGHDYRSGRDTSHLPGAEAALEEVPRTWRGMDAVLAYWQDLGVGGFRVDMAHLIPIEFWRWVIARCRARDEEVLFTAEAYDNDPAKLYEGDVLEALLAAGFDAVYDAPAYDLVKGIYESGKWANDLAGLIFVGERFHQSLRYIENHDEVRVANPTVWGGHGMAVGKPASAALFGWGRGPVMIYHGQEVGEQAIGAEGFSGDNARTSIFDYTAIPELQKWVNGGRFDGALLSEEQQDLRAWYGKLLKVIGEPAFATGETYGLNHANLNNSMFGRTGSECCSGHWLFAFLRRDGRSGQAFLVVVNFHPSQAFNDVGVRMTHDARAWLQRSGGDPWRFTDRLHRKLELSIPLARLDHSGLRIPRIEACDALLFEID